MQQKKRMIRCLVSQMRDVLVPTEIDQEVEEWHVGHKMKTKSWESERICWDLDDNMVIL
jgi:hypothetical protein